MVKTFGILNSISKINAFSKEIAGYKSYDIISERVTSKIKELINVDDAILYLFDRGRIIYKDITHTKSISTNIEDISALKHVLKIKKPLIIPNVKKLRDSEYDNSFLDIIETDTEIKSCAIIPIYNDIGNLKLVLFLTNPKKPNGEKFKFTTENIGISLKTASLVIPMLERSNLIKSMILRMVKISNLKDPNETGSHVMRVGTYSAEIFHRWAKNNNMPDDYTYNFKDQIRLAAMLHDIGKAGIDEVILKKPGKLTPDEYEHIKTHCILGAKIFGIEDSSIDRMTKEVILHHHQKWDGTGYGDPERTTLIKKQIPLSARIVAVADVFDALVSKRCYKPAFSFDKACGIIKEMSGTHFDPDVVKAFFDIKKRVISISKIYSE